MPLLTNAYSASLNLEGTYQRLLLKEPTELNNAYLLTHYYHHFSYDFTFRDSSAK